MPRLAAVVFAVLYAMCALESPAGPEAPFVPGIPALEGTTWTRVYEDEGVATWTFETDPIIGSNPFVVYMVPGAVIEGRYWMDNHPDGFPVLRLTDRSCGPTEGAYSVSLAGRVLTLGERLKSDRCRQRLRGVPGRWLRKFKGEPE